MSCWIDVESQAGWFGSVEAGGQIPRAEELRQEEHAELGGLEVQGRLNPDVSRNPT